MHETIDLPYVFEFWVKNTLREVPMRMFSSLTERMNVLVEVVGKVDNAIHRINHYPADSVVCFVTG